MDASAGVTRERYAAADLVIDVGQQRVTRDGVEIPLPRLSFDLLVTLVREAPNVVSEPRLLKLVWPGLVVGSKTVSQRAKLLRDALGDSAREPRYVAALRSRGYRFVGPVTALGADVPASTAVLDVAPSLATPAPLPGLRRTHGALVLAVCAAVALVAGAAAVVNQSDRDLEPVAQPVAASEPTVAVLPFRHVGSDDDAYMADGIALLLTGRLAATPGLKVIGTDSTTQPSLRGLSARDAGRRLQVAHVVHGTLQRRDGVLTVSASLTDVASGAGVWTDRIDAPSGDVAPVRERLASGLVSALTTRVAGVGRLPAPMVEATSLDARVSFLQASVLLGRGTVRDAERAAELLEQTIAVEPGLAAAHAALYDARMLAADRRHQDLRAAHRRHQASIARALQLDPASGAAHFAKAIWAPAGDPDREASFQIGLRRDPSNGRGITAYALFLDREGRRVEAEAMYRRAISIDPLSPAPHFHLAVRGFRTVGPAQLQASVRRVLEAYPDFQPALRRVAKYHWILNGELVEAAQLMERAIAMDPENPWPRHMAAAIYLDLGDVEAARAVSRGNEVSAHSTAMLLALRAGDVHAAAAAALGPGGTEFNHLESWGQVEAIRDHVLQGGDAGVARAFLTARYNIAPPSPPTIDNVRATMAVAQILRLQGEEKQARALLEAILPAVDASLRIYGSVFTVRTKAAVLVLLGRRDEALAALEQSFRGRDYTQWWYTLEHDPVWAPLRDDPRFQAIARDVRAHVAAEREQLLGLRRAGRMPVYGDARLAAATRSATK